MKNPALPGTLELWRNPINQKFTVVASTKESDVRIQCAFTYTELKAFLSYIELEEV